MNHHISNFWKLLLGRSIFINIEIVREMIFMSSVRKFEKKKIVNWECLSVYLNNFVYDNFNRYSHGKYFNKNQIKSLKLLGYKMISNVFWYFFAFYPNLMVFFIFRFTLYFLICSFFRLRCRKSIGFSYRATVIIVSSGYFTRLNWIYNT